MQPTIKATIVNKRMQPNIKTSMVNKRMQPTLLKQQLLIRECNLLY